MTLGGYLGDHAPTDDNGFVDFARSLQKPEIFDLVSVAEPLCPLMPYQFSANLRRHFEELSRFPAGFLVFPWQIAVGSDLQHPRVEGKRTTQVRFINWYIANLYRAAQDDVVLASRFLQVANLMRQPAALFDPQIAFRVWKGNRALGGMITIPRGMTT